MTARIAEGDISQDTEINEHEVNALRESILDASDPDSSNLYGEVFDLAKMAPLSAASAVSSKRYTRPYILNFG
jgi:hypothetical protein